jgi:hypothetical protein
MAKTWRCKSGWRLRRNGLWRSLRCRHLGSHAAFDDLVQLATIKPNAAALRAIVDLDALAVTHDKRDLANRAWHSNGWVHIGSPLNGLKRSDIAVR